MILDLNNATKFQDLPFKKTSGIYFLLKGAEVVYVGQSLHIHSRLSDHMIDDAKEFDDALVIETDKSLLDIAESFFIQTLKPPLNVRDGSLKVMQLKGKATSKPVTIKSKGLYPMPQEMPKTGFLRQWQIIGSRKAKMAAPLLDVSAATLWRWVAAGTFPKPHKISSGITAWRAEDINEWFAANAA